MGQYSWDFSQLLVQIKKTNKTKISLNLFLGKFCFKQSEQNLIQSLTNFTQPNFKKEQKMKIFLLWGLCKVK